MYNKFHYSQEKSDFFRKKVKNKMKNIGTLKSIVDTKLSTKACHCSKRSTNPNCRLSWNQRIVIRDWSIEGELRILKLFKTKKSQPNGCDFFILRILRVLREPNYSAENLQTRFLSP
jgi:hypothetical protein